MKQKRLRLSRRYMAGLRKHLKPGFRADTHSALLPGRQAVHPRLATLELARLYEQSLHLQGQLRNLSREVLRVQEAERKRIGRELDDVIAQTLTGINVRLAALKKEVSFHSKGFDRNLDRTQRMVENSVESVQRFASELRPAVLDDLGLIPALHTFLKTFSQRTLVHAHLKAFAAVEELDTAGRTVLFRVAQEALTNVARHAHAHRVEISIQTVPAGVCMKIKDDGVSFPVDHVLCGRGSNHLGLLGMRERLEMVGGHFEVESVSGNGTTITAQIPMARPRAGMSDRSPGPKINFL